MKRFKYLFSFIQNLNKSEKRFFKLYAKLYHRQNNKNYILLFDVLEKAKIYDEDAIKNKVIEKIPNANLGSVKTYLKEQLFTSLRLYHRNNTDNPKYFDDLAMAQLLMAKGHYHYAQEILEKLERDTLQTEKHLPHIAAQTLLNTCLHVQNSRDLDTVQKSIDYYGQTLKQIELFKESISIRRLYKKITNIIYAPQFNQDKEAALIKLLKELENKELKDIENISTKYYYLQCKFIIYDNISKNTLQKIALLEELLVVVDLTIEKGIFKQGKGWVTLVNLAGLYKMTANKEKFYQTIQKLDTSVIDFDGLRKNNVLYWKYTRIYEFYYDFPDEKLLPNLLENTEKWLNNTKIPVNEKHKTGLRFVIARYHLAFGNYHAAIKQLNTILLQKDIEINDYYYLHIKGLYIICQYEIKTYTVAKKELLALKRKLRRDELATEKVKKLLKILTSIINLENQEYDISKYYQRIIDVFKNDKEQEFQRNVLDFLCKWAKNKLAK